MKYKGFIITCIEDKAENLGGYYCEIYKSQADYNDGNYFDYFVIHKEDVSKNSIRYDNECVRLIKEYIDKEFKIMLRDILKQMSKEELIKLIVAYDNYIKDFDEDFQNLDRVPVCVNEFLDNEFGDEYEG